MKNKKLRATLIIVAAAILLAALGITAGASFFSNRIEDRNIEKRPQAVTTKKWTFADNSTRTLTYWKSEKSDPENKDAYIDIYRNEKDQYWFDENENLIAFSNTDHRVTEETVITKEQAKEIADRHISALYGNLKGYCFNGCNYYEADKTYDITYALIYNDFIIADVCVVSLNSDGTVYYSRAPQGEDFTEFDKSLLSGITKKSLESNAHQQVAKRLNPNQYDNVIISGEIWLNALQNGKYQIHIPITATLQGESVLCEDLIYPL